jgi:hypothetical protein
MAGIALEGVALAARLVPRDLAKDLTRRALLKTRSRESLVRSLEGVGYRFSDMDLVTDGDWAPEDSDWNYKDIPHFHYVHQGDEGDYSPPPVMGDAFVSSINLQKVLGFKFPIVVVVYEYEKFRQVYYTTLFFFMLIVETRSEAIGELRTRVTTTYSIGHPWWAGFLAPAMKWVIRRNYRFLMSGDVPMRERRGALRRLGYGFRMDGETCGFEATTRILEENLQPPPAAPRTVTCNYVALLADRDRAYAGDIGLLGVRLERDGGELVVLPRACPHEGAGLDDIPCRNGIVQCPWHGRRLSPIGRIEWLADADLVSGRYRLKAEGEMLSVEYLDALRTGAAKDAALSGP